MRIGGLYRTFLFALAAITVACAAPAPTTAPGAPAPISAEAPRPATPKRVTAAIRAEPPTLNKTLNTIIPGTTALEALVSAGMGVTDDQGRQRPQLAVDIPSVENGLWKVLPDGRMETTWPIRPGAKWHDGSPFTAEDLAFTIRVAQDRELPLFAIPASREIEAVEIVDPQTALIRWRRAYIRADMLFSTDNALPLPRHRLEKTFLEDKAAFADDPYWSLEFVGTGPFRVHEWAKGSHVTLTANPDYVLGRPKIDEITVKFIPDGNTLTANLLAGAVELTIGERNFSLEEALLFRDQWREGALAPGDRSVMVAFPQLLNPTPPSLTDVRLRRALLHGMDRQEFVDNFQAGLTEVAHGYLSPDTREYADTKDAAVRYDYDPRRAATLIEELGYRKGPDSVYRDPAGNRLAVEVRTTTLSENQKVMLSIVDFWTRLGVAAEPHTVPQARSQEPEYRAAFPGFEVIRQGNGTNIVNNLHSAGARIPENGFRAANTNYPRYMDPEFDRLVERYNSTIPWSERMDTLRQIVRQLTDQVLVMGLFFSTEANMVSHRLTNVTARRAWNAHEWELK